MNLSGKIVVITGASDGIGKQIALRLAKEHVSLALIARDKEKLQNVKDKIEKISSSTAAIYCCDLGKREDLDEVVKKIILDFGFIDILINNAGIWQKLAPLEEIDIDVVDRVIGINLIALIKLTKLFIPVLKSREEAAIINVISKSGITAQEGQSVYTASKYGVRGFTEVLKIDLKDSNIKVAGLYQGGTDTEMFKKAGENFSTSDFTDPTDLADVVSYMLSAPKKLWLHDVRIDR